jgi:hypothetical protein
MEQVTELKIKAGAEANKQGAAGRRLELIFSMASLKVCLTIVY